jgi:hypothetical protein
MVIFNSIDSLQKCGQEMQEFDFTEVVVCNLTISDLESLVSNVFGVGGQDLIFSTCVTSAVLSTATKWAAIHGKIHELAHVLQKKTHGNAYFLNQFVSALKQEQDHTMSRIRNGTGIARKLKSKLLPLKMW